MTKDKSGANGKARKAKVKIPKQVAGVKIPKALRDKGNAAIKMAQQPGTREMVSMGLMAAATAIAANARARSATTQGAKDGQAAMADATQQAADTAQKIGAALIGAAGLAAQRFFGLADDQAVAPGTTREAETAPASNKVDDEPTLEFPAPDAPAAPVPPVAAKAAIKKPVRTSAAKPRPVKPASDNSVA